MLKRVLLIGASGFVGTRLIETIGEKRCINIDKQNSSRYNNITLIHDIRNDGIDVAISHQPSSIVLLAAEHRDDVSPISLYYDVNVQGTKNVLDAMDHKGIKSIIFTSSVAVYGLNKKFQMKRIRLTHSTIMGKVNGKLKRCLENGIRKILKPLLIDYSSYGYFR